MIYFPNPHAESVGKTYAESEAAQGSPTPLNAKSLSFLTVSEWAWEELNFRPHAYQAEIYSLPNTESPTPLELPNSRLGPDRKSRGLFLSQSRRQNVGSHGPERIGDILARMPMSDLIGTGKEGR